MCIQNCIVLRCKLSFNIFFNYCKGQTPLHIAAAHGADSDLAQVLLMHPYLKPNKLNNSKDTPTDIANRSSKYHNIFDIADPLLDLTNLE